MMKTNYVLGRDDEGAERLRVLARVKWPSTLALLRRAGLKRGMRCLDVGCGIGEVTLQMAHVVGVEGKAVGLDSDAAFLQSARREAKRRGLSPSFRKADALKLDEEPLHDLVFARYLLTHLSRPQAALSGMIAATRPGGTVVVEDVDFPGHVCFPKCRAFDRYLELYQAVVRRNGGDATLGRRLHALFMESGLGQVRVDIAQPTFRQGEGKLLAQITMEGVREAVVGAGLASHEEVDSIVSELDQFARNPRTIMSIPRTFQVFGRKPDR